MILEAIQVDLVVVVVVVAAAIVNCLGYLYIVLIIGRLFIYKFT